MFLSRYTAIAFLLFAVLFPVRTRCDNPRDCGALPDYRGQIRSAYKIQPLSIHLLEEATGTELPVIYRHGVGLF